MRKNVMLSLLAASTASLGVYANADLSSKILNSKVSDWGTGTGVKLEGTVITSPGVAISQNLTLLPGKYTLGATMGGTAGTHGKVVIAVGSKSSTTGSVDFEITGTTEQTVTVTISSSDQTDFTASDFVLTLNYNFEESANKLLYLLGLVKNSCNLTAENPLYSEYEKIASDISTIKDDGGVDGSYTVYKNFELYKGYGESTPDLRVAQSTIKSRIDALETKANNSNGYQAALTAINNANTSLAAAKGNLDAATAYAKGKYTSAYEAIVTTISTFKSTADAANTAGTAATLATTKFTTDVNAAISSLNTNISTANQNDADYNAIVTKITTVKTAYSEALKVLVAALPGTPDVYGDMLTKAQAELKTVTETVANAETANGTAESHDNATKNKTSNNTILDKASADIASIQTKYTNEATGYKTSFATAKGELKSLETQYAGVDTKGVTTVATLISTIATDTTSMKKMIDDANADHTITTLLSKTAYSDIKTKISKEITALKDSVDNFNANVAVKDIISKLQQKLNTTKSAVQALTSSTKYATSYTVGTKYATTEKSLQGAIDKFTTDLKYNYARFKAVDYKTNTDFTTAGTNIDSYKAQAEDGVKAYNAVGDSIEALTGEKTTLTAVAKNTKVITTDNSTYGEKITALDTEIKRLKVGLTSAVAKSDVAHYNALVTLRTSLKTTFYTETKQLCAEYDAQEKAYEKQVNIATANSMKTQALASIDALNTELEGLQTTSSAKYTAAALGISETKYTTRLNALIGRVATQKTAVSATDPDNNAIATIATISTANTELAKISTAEADLKLYGDSAIANVNAKTTADKKVSDLQAKLPTITSSNTDTNTAIVKKFTDIRDKQYKNLTEQSAAILTSYKKEALVADWTKTISAKLTAIEDTINTAINDAKAAATNYTAKTTQEGLVTTAGFTALISTAKADVNSVTANGGATYYNDVILAGYQTQADQISTDITSYYNAGTSDSKTADVKSRITTLTTNIKAVKNLAKTNNDAYLSETDSLKKVQTYFGDIYFAISTKDQSSKQKYYVDSLVVLQTKLNALGTDIDKYFGQGNSDEKKVNLIGQITSLKNAISDLNAKQNSGYNTVIAADNAARHTNITNIVSQLQTTYNDAVTIINKYSTTANASNYIDKIVQYSKNIYTYASLITKLSSDIETAYGKVVLPDTFAIKNFVETANTYSDNIASQLTLFRNDANTYAKDYFANTANPEANRKLAEAVQKLTDKGYLAVVKNAAFTDVRTLINNAVSKESTSLDFALDLDVIKSGYATIDAKLAAGFEPEAVDQWHRYKDSLDAKIKTQTADIKKYNLADYTSQYNDKLSEIKTEYGKATADSLGGTLYANLNDIMTALDVYMSAATTIHDNAKVAYDALVANKAAYDAMVTAIGKTQTALDNAKNYVAWYCIAPNMASTITGYQNQIDGFTTTAEDKGNAAANKTTVISNCTNLTNSINNIYRNANVLEINALTEKISVLKNDFNQAMAALNVGASDSRVAGDQTKITSYTTALGTITTNNTNANTLAKVQAIRTDLVNLEQNIATTHSDLAKLYNSALESSTLASLNTALGKVESDYNAETSVLAGCDEKVKSTYSLDGINKAITIAKDSISKRNGAGMLLFYSDNISSYISSIATDLATVTANIKTMQDKITANKDAYASLGNQITEIKSRLTSVLGVIDAYEYKYDYKLAVDGDEATNVLGINDYIKSSQDDADNQYAAETLNANSTLLNKTYINGLIDNLEKEGAKFDADRKIAALNTGLNDVKAIFASHSSVYTTEISNLLNSQINTLGD